MSWSPPEHWLRVTTLDAHTAGEPLRIFTGGFPKPKGTTILEKRRELQEHYDNYRRILMWEPRGHADMYGCLLTEPVTPDAHVGALFLHNEGYSTMCGHAIIALVTAGIEANLLPAFERRSPKEACVRIDTPAGRVTAMAALEGKRVAKVSFENVPSFVLQERLKIHADGIGAVTTDIAYGGAFYAYVMAKDVGVKDLAAVEAPRLIEIGMKIKQAVMQSFEIRHPEGDEDLNFLYGTIFIQPENGAVHSRNVCIFADGELDRSPTGTGVSGRAALHFARNEIREQQTIRIASYIGSEMSVKVLRTCKVGSLPAVVPAVSGSAYLTGRHEFFVDPCDPLGQGFFLRT